jgi:hypothetical protein
MIHCEGREYVAEVENAGHLMNRLEKWFPEWWNLSERRLSHMQTGEIRDGGEIWLIDMSYFTPGEMPEGDSHPRWNDDISAFRIEGKWYLLRSLDVRLESRLQPGGIQGMIARKLRVPEHEIV